MPERVPGGKFDSSTSSDHSVRRKLRSLLESKSHYQISFVAVFDETPSEEDIVGVASLIIYTITALVLVKYALIVLRADDNGQG